jgi:hypothetical protein
LQNLGVDFGKVLEGRHFADEPEMVGVEEHNFYSFLVSKVEIGLVVELAGARQRSGERARKVGAQQTGSRWRGGGQ